MTAPIDLTVNGASRLNGRVAVNGFGPFSNAAMTMSGDENFVFYAQNTATAGVFSSAIFGTMTEMPGSGAFGAGVWGNSASTAFDAVFSEGRLRCFRNQVLREPHPADASKEIRFVCLEGNEAGTYFRGKTRIVNGTARIEVPSDFRMVTDPEGMTVQLTAIGRGDVWVESYDLDDVEIAGERDIEVHYVVNGIRRGYTDFETIQPNRAYRPRVANKPFGTQYPAEIRELLVRNGTLNRDYTPSQDKAAELGWSLMNEAAQPAFLK